MNKNSCMYMYFVCMHVCMYYVRTHGPDITCMYVCVCMYFMYVRMCICTYMYVHHSYRSNLGYPCAGVFHCNHQVGTLRIHFHMSTLNPTSSQYTYIHTYIHTIIDIIHTIHIPCTEIFIYVRTYTTLWNLFRKRVPIVVV